MKYELGELDKRAADHGKSVIDEMMKHLENADEVACTHSVVVCVYADGFLQFAGGNACCSTKTQEIQRDVVKTQAYEILARMDDSGTINKKDSAEST